MMPLLVTLSFLIVCSKVELFTAIRDRNNVSRLIDTAVQVSIASSRVGIRVDWIEDRAISCFTKC